MVFEWFMVSLTWFGHIGICLSGESGQFAREKTGRIGNRNSTAEKKEGPQTYSPAALLLFGRLRISR